MHIPKRGPVVAIDGPAGTGKSSVTKRLSEKLGFVHVDTGALYRAIALMSMERNLLVTPEQVDERVEEQIVEIARSANLQFVRDPAQIPTNRIIANGVDVTAKIRTPEVSMLASRVSAIPGVRACLLGLQRRLGCVGKSILEGRDIGTVIFPDADVKFFMVASLEARVERRLLEMKEASEKLPSFEELKKQMALRDEQDSHREIAPLKKAPDAIEVDTTQLTLDQVVERMEKMIRSRLSR